MGVAASLPETAEARPAEPASSANTNEQQNAAAAAEHQSPGNAVYIFFNQDEAKFIEAATERLIPKDDKWAGAFEAGVPVYIDRQLAGSYGAGDRMYLDGPWQQGTPAQGYQLPYTPAQLYRIAIDDLHQHLTSGGGKAFHDRPGQEQDSILKNLERGQLTLPNVAADVFFETLLANTVEGFFADPVYSGNRDMVGWRMVGFPGVYAVYTDLVDNYGVPFTREPLSLASVGRNETR